MTSPVTRINSPNDRHKKRLMEWHYLHQDIDGVTTTHMDLADKCLTVGDVYRSIESRDDKKDASILASRMTHLALRTLDDNNATKVNGLHDWFQWLEEQVNGDPKPMRPQVSLLSLVERLYDVVKGPSGTRSLELGPDFKGIDASVTDNTSDATYTASQGGRVNIKRGSEIGKHISRTPWFRSWFCTGTHKLLFVDDKNISENSIQAAVYDDTSNIKYQGEIRKSMGATVSVEGGVGGTGSLALVDVEVSSL